jgi:hypothetical protein
MRAYGPGGEAAVLGRIIPDITKKGGPFSSTGDFDFAIFHGSGMSTIRPGTEAIRFASPLVADTLANRIKEYIPEGMRGLQADFDYAKYENQSLRGFDTTYRGRATFTKNGFERQSSVIYGAGGAITRDLPDLFSIRQPLQEAVSRPFNVENLDRWLV